MGSFEYSEDRLIEQTAMQLFEQLGWQTYTAYENETFGQSNSFLGRGSKKETILTKYLFPKLREFNPGLPEKTYQDAYEKLLESSSSKSLGELNHEKYKLLRDGIQLEFINPEKSNNEHKTLKVFDFENPSNNHFIAISQLWIEGKSKRTRRPDIIGFVNGIPLLFIELKAHHRNLQSAYTANFTDYKDTIPHLFYCNAFVILSNGIQSRVGSITGKYEHFHEWKRISEDEEGIVALDRIIQGICDKQRFLDLFSNFILFDTDSGKVAKLIARNHQFIGVNKAIQNIIHKEELYRQGKIDAEEKQKLGVFWHTQGSGKSYSMVFFCQKIHRTFKGSYTFLIVTDRQELENQIYGTFSSIGAVAIIKAGSAESVVASSGQRLQELLKAEHRYIFTLVHKFNFQDVIERKNVIVLSDEAHRTQGGTFALNMRNILPNASFIGFTGTPLFKDDELTKRLFGDYVSRYDFKRSVDDGATVPLYYENRGEYLGLKNPNINQEMRELIDSESENLDSDQKSKVERLFASEYPIITAQSRLEDIAKDVVTHFFNRGYKGKGMFIAFDKLTAVKMYDLIIRYWKLEIERLEKEARISIGDQEDLERNRELAWIKETEICVVVSSEQNEIQKFRNWNLDIEPHREKMNTDDLEARFKEPNDPFRLVIVCAMWITGFDVPTLSTLYLDKPLKAHTLMQAIARANRISEGKNNGLIVDYIETYSSLLDALAIYGTGSGESEGNGKKEAPVRPEEELIALLEESLHETEMYLLNDLNFDINTLVKESNPLHKMKAVELGIEAIYRNDETKRKFQILAREVFKKYSALKPNTVINQFTPRKNAVDALYSAIEDKIESADVSDIMAKVQELVNNSIISQPSVGDNAPTTIVDLSNLDFEVLERYFNKAKNKRTAVQSLKERIEKKLQIMIDRNPMMIDYYERYQEIIEEYNKGKDESIIKETFRKLIELVNSYSLVEAETRREGLTEEQKAIFDILRDGKELNKSEKEQIKSISVSMLEELKKDRLRIDNWSEKTETSATVVTYVRDTLFEKLPYPTYEQHDIDHKSNRIYEHLRSQYYGGGNSMYGRY